MLAAPRAVRGLELLAELAATPVVLPELDALRDVEQNHFHHADVYGHTLEVLQRTIALGELAAAMETTGDVRAGPAERGGAPDRAVFGEHRAAVAALLDEPLADGLTRGEALRWGALLHDAAKPLTRDVRPADGRVTFIGHDERARRSRARCSAGCAQRAPARARRGARAPSPAAGLSRARAASRWRGARCSRYLRTCAPVEVDVTLLSVADRLATRGDRAEQAIEAHLAVARAMLGDALRWRGDGPPRPLVRGDELARALGIAEGRASASCWRSSARRSTPARSPAASRRSRTRARSC